MKSLLRELLEHEEVRKMVRFRQHGKVSTLQHCQHVAADPVPRSEQPRGMGRMYRG